MKVGVIPINIGVQTADQVVQTAQLVESLGYESVWTFEHVIAREIRLQIPLQQIW